MISSSKIAYNNDTNTCQACKNLYLDDFETVATNVLHMLNFFEINYSTWPTFQNTGSSAEG